MQQKFDAIVVGAGPAGCACGYKLAKAGLNVLVVEKGKFAGAKNTWGGAFYGPALNELIPNFWEEAPIERFIARQRVSFMNKEGCLTVEFTMPQFSQPPYNGFILLRSKFDRWLAKKVQEAGALLITAVQADELLWDGNRVVGIKAGKDELPAEVVVACDGANSLLAQKARLRKELSARDVKQGVKEVIELPREVIERRFGLADNEGIAWGFVGSCTRGLPGGGFIYTNKESISIGVVVQLSALAQKKVRPNDLLESFKQHPAIAPLIEGGKLVEYSAHLIPASGISMMPKLYADGFLVAGDAAALVLGTGLLLEGANFAIASGMLAAQAIKEAKQKGDFSARTLSYYQKLLEESFVLKDLRTFEKAPHFLERSRIYTSYPDLICDLARMVFTNDGQPRKRAWDCLREAMKGKVSLLQMAFDLIKARGAM